MSALDRVTDMRPLDLDRDVDDVVSVAESPFVDLRDGGAREGRRVDLFVEVGDGAAQVLFDLELDLRPGDGLDVVLQDLELGDHVAGDEVRARRGDLTELHERGPEVLQHEAQALTEGGRVHLGVFAATGHEALRARRWSTSPKPCFASTDAISSELIEVAERSDHRWHGGSSTAPIMEAAGVARQAA